MIFIREINKAIIIIIIWKTALPNVHQMTNHLAKSSIKHTDMWNKIILNWSIFKIYKTHWIKTHSIYLCKNNLNVNWKKIECFYSVCCVLYILNIHRYILNIHRPMIWKATVSTIVWIVFEIYCERKRSISFTKWRNRIWTTTTE